jgi:2-dehydropantoate 2-reductase
MPRILIVGTGSIGIVYSVIFTRAGAEVVCVCRSNYDEARASGLKLESQLFGDQTIHPTVVSSVDEAARTSDKPFDYVVVATKSFPGSQLQSVQSLKPMLNNAATSVVLLQNGIGIEKDYHQEHPGTQIISGVVYMPTSRTSPTSVKHTEVERLYLGPSPFGDKHGLAEGLSTVLRAGGATVSDCEDIQGERWKKIVANGTWNPLCALSRCRDLQLLAASPLTLQVVNDIMREICAVAAACGYAKYANEEAIAFQLSRSRAREYPGVEPSMMADMDSGREMEVEAILGGIVKYSQEYNIEVPRLETIYILLVGLNSSFKKQEYT